VIPAEEIKKTKEKQEELDSLKSQVEKLKDEIKEETDSWASQILKGDTTGDKIKDYIIVRHRIINGEIESFYKNIWERVKAHKGECALIVTRWEEPLRQHLHHDPILHTFIHLGKISQDHLHIEPQRNYCAIPTARFVSCLKRENRISVVDGSLEDTNTSYSSFMQFRFMEWWGNVDQPVQVKGDTNKTWVEVQKHPFYKLSLRIGDREVRDWFENDRHVSTGRLYKMLEHLEGPSETA
jgi:hypothetical protein